MAFSPQWVRFRQAEEAFFTYRQEVSQDVAALGHDLKQALASVDDRETALRLLVEIAPPLAVLQPLMADVVATALDSSSLTAIGLARQVIVQYKADSWVRSMVPRFAAPYLVANDEWHYRRIAELYGFLNYDEELADFLVLCQVNANAEIQEISADYQRG